MVTSPRPGLPAATRSVSLRDRNYIPSTYPNERGNLNRGLLAFTGVRRVQEAQEAHLREVARNLHPSCASHSVGRCPTQRCAFFLASAQPQEISISYFRPQGRH